MTARDMIRQRLASQQVAVPRLTTAAEIVSWLGAVQSQDYPSAKWALGVRLQSATDLGIEEAVDRGLVVRMHLLRPTWHFAARDDARWMLALSAPQIRAAMKSRDRQLGITDDVARKSNRVIARTLKNEESVPRERLVEALEAEGMENRDNRAAHLLMRAETDGVACCAVSRGGRQEYALFDARIPPQPPLKRDEAMARLAERYFCSRWPATLHDFAWWSGLTFTDAKRAFEAVKSGFGTETIDSKTYVIAGPSGSPAPDGSRADLLPAYDEMILSYADRAALLTRTSWTKMVTTNGIIRPLILVNGRAIGTWKREADTERVVLTMQPFAKTPVGAGPLIQKAAERYAAFLGKAVEVRRETPRPKGKG
ncbi:MAG TPA: winged helix DNA-binding domain-containing protein [Spirochaetia bacterium]|nr:winged helix DNA-binding domain-containing protein [Spirochaetia bacterium]